MTDPSDEDPTMCCIMSDKPYNYNDNCACDSLYADSGNDYW